MHVIVIFFSFSKIKNLMYFLGVLWIEAVSSEFKLQQWFRLLIEENLFRVRLMSPLFSPGLVFNPSHW